MTVVKRKNKFYQLAFIGKSGSRYPEREIKPRNHLGYTRYRYQKKWFSKQKLESICEPE